jgi:hypothetical protein
MSKIEEVNLLWEFIYTNLYYSIATILVDNGIFEANDLFKLSFSK